MMHKMTFRLLLLFTLGVVNAHAWADGEPPQQITLYPVAASRPALKYHLLPDFMDRIPGNAAVYYGKVTSEQLNFFTNHKLWEDIERWRATPLAELRDEQIRLNTPGIILTHLERAARCRHCDWQLLPVDGEPFYSVLLPDIQQSRQFARLLGTQARIQIARGQYDDALRTLQSGYALGRHIAAGETLINGLIGLSIASRMNDQLLTMIQQPDSPSLYWALTSLPSPLVNIRPGIEADMRAIELSFPDVRDVATAQRSPDQWRESLHRFYKELGQFSNISTTDFRVERLAAASVRGYPKAKLALIQQGRSEEEVDAMPVAQVILIYTMQTYSELRDELFKCFFVPYASAQKEMVEAKRIFSRAISEEREIIPAAQLMLPAVESCRTAMVRHEREFAVLRVLEALRIYGATHDGQLPERLEDISEVPVPTDPVTGNPFEYRLELGKAHLQGPSLPGRPLSFEITMERKRETSH